MAHLVYAQRSIAILALQLTFSTQVTEYVIPVEYMVGVKQPWSGIELMLRMLVPQSIHELVP